MWMFTKKEATKKDITLSWLLLFLLQCTVSNYCFYKLSLAISYIDLSDFLSKPTGLVYHHASACISSTRHSRVVSHHTAGVHYVGLMIYKTSF